MSFLQVQFFHPRASHLKGLKAPLDTLLHTSNGTVQHKPARTHITAVTDNRWDDKLVTTRLVLKKGRRSCHLITLVSQYIGIVSSCGNSERVYWRRLKGMYN